MNELIEFSIDTENAQKNYNLAKWYENQGHTAPAHTYYLRAAERANDESKSLAYQALIRSSFCYRSQGSRDSSEKVLLENALTFLPQRPEAYYFLSLFYEKKKEWQNCYIYASLGLEFCQDDLEPLDLPEFQGKYLLIFEKAVSSWWWGKGMEARKLLSLLVDEYWDQIDQTHRDAIEDNITRLGSGPESQAFYTYTKEDHSKLRFKFKDSEQINKNHSQVYQDIFILSMLNGKKNGTYLEIGGGHPFSGNNTAILESYYNWTGISFELKNEFVTDYLTSRKNPVLQEDALTINYRKFLNENYKTKEIDYLQLDIEPARNTFEVLLSIPFEEYKFAVITYEHDYYVDITKSYREKSRKYLSLMGYELIVNDISPDGISNFEDWWVHPDLVDKNIIEIMKDTSEQIKKAKSYILCNE